MISPISFRFASISLCLYVAITHSISTTTTKSSLIIDSPVSSPVQVSAINMKQLSAQIANQIDEDYHNDTINENDDHDSEQSEDDDDDDNDEMYDIELVLASYRHHRRQQAIAESEIAKLEAEFKFSSSQIQPSSDDDDDDDDDDVNQSFNDASADDDSSSSRIAAIAATKGKTNHNAPRKLKHLSKKELAQRARKHAGTERGKKYEKVLNRRRAGITTRKHHRANHQ
jgi:hypothetical protein